LSVEPLGDLCVDEDGTLYRIARFNPLLTERPGEQDVAGFTVAGDDSLLFLQKSSNPATVLELEQQQIEHGRNAAANAKAHAEFLADQPQLVPLLPGAHCELRESVKAITDHGGKITVGAFGEVNVSLPARLLNCDNALEGTGEIQIRQGLDTHIEAVVRCWRVVLPALNSSSKKPLHERIPAGYPTAGGGLSDGS
jgi:hypothetical protein